MKASSYSIFNLEGKIVLTGKLVESQTIINTSKLDKGYYFILLQNEKEKKTFSFLKM
jgi:hypothetical protein